MWSSYRLDAHLLTLTISTPETVEHPVRVGSETRMQRERIQRTREIKTTRSADSLISSFKEVNRVFGGADIEFGCATPRPNPSRRRGDPKRLTTRGFLMLAAGFPMDNAVSLLLVRRFGGLGGGASKEKLGVCAVGESSADTALAHEFGHPLVSSTRVTYGI
jgi:hypothetical protein